MLLSMLLPEAGKGKSLESESIMRCCRVQAITEILARKNWRKMLLGDEGVVRIQDVVKGKLGLGGRTGIFFPYRLINRRKAALRMAVPARFFGEPTYYPRKQRRRQVEIRSELSKCQAADGRSAESASWHCSSPSSTSPWGSTLDLAPRSS